jgi:NADH dehydrogenase FAD-containing subunit
VDPKLFEKAHCPHRAYLDEAKGHRLLVGACRAVHRTHVVVGDGGERVPFDALVYCAGSSYPSDIKCEAPSVDYRRRQFEGELERLQATPPAFVIAGCGSVGVEQAFELKDKFPDAPVHVYQRNPTR